MASARASRPSSSAVPSGRRARRPASTRCRTWALGGGQVGGEIGAALVGEAWPPRRRDLASGAPAPERDRRHPPRTPRSWCGDSRAGRARRRRSAGGGPEGGVELGAVVDAVEAGGDRAAGVGDEQDGLEVEPEGVGDDLAGGSGLGARCRWGTPRRGSARPRPPGRRRRAGRAPGRRWRPGSTPASTSARRRAGRRRRRASSETAWKGHGGVRVQIVATPRGSATVGRRRDRQGVTDLGEGDGLVDRARRSQGGAVGERRS